MSDLSTNLLLAFFKWSWFEQQFMAEQFDKLDRTNEIFALEN